MPYTRFALCILLLGAAQSLPAQNQKGKKKAAAEFVPPANVAVTPDLVYATYGERQLRLDLYLPKPKPAGAVPGLVVIRGGGWRVGDRKGFAPIAAGLAAKGFAAACIEYRVMPDVEIADEVGDTKAAVRWMRAEGKRYGIQTGEIGVIGGSAGGHLVALLGTSYKEASLEGTGGHAGVSSRVQAVVAMAPVVDFVSMAKVREQSGGDAVRSFMRDPQSAKRLSPVTYLDRDSAPILLLHSNGDKTVPIAQSQEMLERCKKAGVPADMVTIDGAPHAFWNMPQWSAETLDRAATFFHSVLDKMPSGAGAR
jgi:acetyl esterase/lipase